MQTMTLGSLLPISNELPLSPPPSQPQRSVVKPKSAAIVIFAKYFIVIPYNGWIEEKSGALESLSEIVGWKFIGQSIFKS